MSRIMYKYLKTKENEKAIVLSNIKLPIRKLLLQAQASLSTRKTSTKWKRVKNGRKRRTVSCPCLRITKRIWWIKQSIKKGRRRKVSCHCLRITKRIWWIKWSIKKGRRRKVSCRCKGITWEIQKWNVKKWKTSERKSKIENQKQLISMLILKCVWWNMQSSTY